MNETFFVFLATGWEPPSCDSGSPSWSEIKNIINKIKNIIIHKIKHNQKILIKREDLEIISITFANII